MTDWNKIMAAKGAPDPDPSVPEFVPLTEEEPWFEGVKRRAVMGGDTGWVRVPLSDWQGLISCFEMGETLYAESQAELREAKRERDELARGLVAQGEETTRAWLRVAEAERERDEERAQKLIGMDNYGWLQKENERLREALGEAEEVLLVVETSARYEDMRIRAAKKIREALEENNECPGWPNCRCIGKSKWSSSDDPHGTFGAPGGMGG